MAILAQTVPYDGMVESIESNEVCAHRTVSVNMCTSCPIHDETVKRAHSRHQQGKADGSYDTLCVLGTYHDRLFHVPYGECGTNDKWKNVSVL